MMNKQTDISFACKTGKHIFNLNNYINRSARIEALDFIRGIAMIVVVLGHAGFPLQKWIYGFHMPVFFIITGFLAYNKDFAWGGGK